MTTHGLLEKIEATLAVFPQDDLVEGGRRLLETLGYRSDRTLELSGDVDDFIKGVSARNDDTQSRMHFRQRANSVHILFQVTDSEISESQPSLLDTGEFDKGDARSFMFIAVELQGKNYARGVYAELTREVNKLLSQPTVVLFRTAEDLLTIAFVHRRPHKRDRTRNVLGSVSLIREIKIGNPHPAHLQILRKLALPERLSWMDLHHKPRNFDGLLAAWLDGLDTEELNRNFYNQLFNWFKRAVDEAKFPDNQVKTLPAKVNVIRLITRLMFVWFIKEKGLIAPKLFIEEQIGPLLRDYDSDNGDSYYRVVLQNLFFATLNSEIGERGFSKEGNSTHRDFSRYRYRAEVAAPDRLLELFGQTPFINGGLFDCLDSFEAPRDGGYRIDCFTDNVIDPKRKEFGLLSIPNRLFFDEEGLISLFDRFQFTVEENTPTEQEVALDPELLGKVFENLLAANVKETEVNARKQTGSYYTPRAVVDYMVDEAIVASLAQKCSPADGDIHSWKERLSHLLDYEDAFDDAYELFEESEREGLVRAIAGLKLVDPAVGSGAFPMGALHKLTLALRRLDPHNRYWQELQKEIARQRAGAAFNTPDQTERNVELEEISDTFQKYGDSDFGRKLFLIQNSIYGVDVQPIACQIARLRFFISLAIEQEKDEEAENFGIKPLPNLDTRFIAANALIGLDPKANNMLLQGDSMQQLRKEMEGVREKYFLASNRAKKLVYIRQEHELREQMKVALEDQRKNWIQNERCEIDRKVGQLPTPEHREQLLKNLLEDFEKRRIRYESGLESVRRIVSWDSHDFNVSADFFDAGWMFGVKNGFDIVIGNPPYIKEYTLRQAFDGIRNSPYYQGKMDIWYMFVCEGIDRMAKDGEGLITFIAQNNWVTSYGASRMRRKVIADAKITNLIDFGSYMIFESGIQTMILTFRKDSVSDYYKFDYRRLRGHNLEFKDVLLLLNRTKTEKAEYLTPKIERKKYANQPLTFNDPKVEAVLEKLSEKSNFRLSKQEIANGIHHHHDRVNGQRKKLLGNRHEVGDGIFVLSEEEKSRIPLTRIESDLVKPAYTTKELHRYFGNPSNREWVIYTDSTFKDRKRIEMYPNIKEHLDQFRTVITSDNKPYGLHRARKEYFFKDEKIVSVRKCQSPTFTYVDFDSYVSAAFYVIKTAKVNQKYLTGLLNSRVVAFWLKHRGKMQGTNYQVDKQPLLGIPLFSPPSHQQVVIIGLVDRILTAKRIELSADTSELEAEIDRQVYILYGLTDEEVAVVEELA